MVTINEEIYMNVAQRLLCAIGETNFFNSTVEFDNEEIYTTLRCTLIVYRETIEDPTETFSRIIDIVPVWWEFATVQQCGTVGNDFSWRELKEYLFS